MGKSTSEWTPSAKVQGPSPNLPENPEGIQAVPEPGPKPKVNPRRYTIQVRMSERMEAALTRAAEDYGTRSGYILIALRRAFREDGFI